MSSQASLSDALAVVPLTRERRPAVAEQAVSAERRDSAWQREMERAQAGAWFPGALPEGAGLFRNRPDAQPARPAAPVEPHSAAAHPAPATRDPKADLTPRRAEVRDERTEWNADGAAASHQRERAQDGPAAAPASSQQVAGPSDDVSPGAREASDIPRAVSRVQSSPEVPSSDEAGPASALRSVAAANAVGLAAPGVPGHAVPAVAPVPASASVAAQPLALASAGAAPTRAADPGASQVNALAASPGQPTGQAARSAEAIPVVAAGAFAAASLPAAADGVAPMAQDGSGTSGAAPGVRSLASIERVLTATLGGAPGPRLHLSWDGQAVAVWLGVDGAVDPTALLRTVQNVLRQQGLQLSSLICNGRTIVLPRQAPGQASNSEHQEH